MDKREDAQKIVNHFKKGNKQDVLVIKMPAQYSDKNLIQERLIACSMEYSKKFGYLRASYNYTVLLEFPDGSRESFGYGRALHHARENLSGQWAKTMRSIDKYWRLPDEEYESQLFMEIAGKYHKKYGDLAMDDDYIHEYKGTKGRKRKYPLGKYLNKARMAINGQPCGLVVTDDMARQLDEWDPEWRTTTLTDDDITLSHEIFLDCCRYHYANNGNLRMPPQTTYDLKYQDGETQPFNIGKLLYTYRDILRENPDSDVLPKYIVDELLAMDQDCLLSDIEYARKQFVQCCNEFFTKHGHLRPSLSDEVTIEYPNGVKESYRLGHKMNNYRYQLKHGCSIPAVNEEVISIMNDMDPYWLNREKTISEMQTEKMLNTQAK